MSIGPNCKTKLISTVNDIAENLDAGNNVVGFFQSI